MRDIPNRKVTVLPLTSENVKLVEKLSAMNLSAAINAVDYQSKPSQFTYVFRQGDRTSDTHYYFYAAIAESTYSPLLTAMLEQSPFTRFQIIYMFENALSSAFQIDMTEVAEAEA